MKLNRKDVRLAKKTLKKVEKLKKMDSCYRISKEDFNTIRRGGLGFKRKEAGLKNDRR